MTTGARFLLMVWLVGPAAAAFAADEPAAAAAASAPAEAAGAPSASAASAPSADDEIDVTPFYSFQWVEGLVVPSINPAGGWFVPASFGTSLGAKYGLNANHALFGVYDLQYEGPGLRTQEGREWADRSIDHNVLLEHQWNGLTGHVLKTRLLFIKEMRRAGSSETFGSGLYDFWTPGIGLIDDMTLRPGLGLGVGLMYQYFRFPNYSDLFQEFAAGAEAPEELGGQYDNHNARLNADLRFRGRGRVGASVGVQQYIKQRVYATVEPYAASETRQRDITGDVGGSWTFQAPAVAGWGRGQVLPALRTSLRFSNQNYIKRDLSASATDFSTTLAIEDYFSSVSVELGLPFKWTFESGTALSLSVRLTPTFYLSRPPQDAAGAYQTSKLYTMPVAVTPSVSFPMSKLLRWSLGYSYVTKSSNMEFERYLPYNFSGHYAFSALDITY